LWQKLLNKKICENLPGSLWVLSSFKDSIIPTHFDRSDFWASKIWVRNPLSTTAMSQSKVLKANEKTSATGKPKKYNKSNSYKNAFNIIYFYKFCMKSKSKNTT